MNDEKVQRTGQRPNNLRDELIWGMNSASPSCIAIHIGVSGAVASRLRQVTKLRCIIAPIERYSGYRHFK